MTEPKNPVAAYVCEMRKRLQEMAELVQVNANKAQQKKKVYYDRGVQQRVLEEGEKVLVLLSNACNRLKLEWVGPYEVKRKCQMWTMKWRCLIVRKRGGSTIST